MIIVFRIAALAVFVHGFAKNDVENIGAVELRALKKLASEMLAYQSEEFAEAVASGILLEVKCNGEREAVS